MQTTGNRVGYLPAHAFVSTEVNNSKSFLTQRNPNDTFILAALAT